MESIGKVRQRIVSVDPGSPAARAGIRPGAFLTAINGVPVQDLIDYTALCAAERLTLSLLDGAGNARTTHVRKDETEPLGLAFDSGLMSKVRVCKNRCVFCFIDQMPKGGRESLHFKDDDWRMSFIIGNYVSLTNVDEAEFARILERRVSPLYISVHATGGALRARMMGNPSAADILPRLTRLAEAGLWFHAQLVLCPGINDGAALEQTLSDLAALRPAARSVAVVPVGLTRFRAGLTPLRCFTAAEAGAVLDALEDKQRGFAAQDGERLCYPSDEWYCLAGRPLPAYESYGDFPQIENGVGLLRVFERDALEALRDKTPLSVPRRVTCAGGTAAAPFMAALLEKYAPYGVFAVLRPVRNDYFGPSVTVGGLVTGGDLLGQLNGTLETDTLIIPRCMLRAGEDVFLDGMTRAELSERLGVRVLPVADGAELTETLLGE